MRVYAAAALIAFTCLGMASQAQADEPHITLSNTAMLPEGDIVRAASPITPLDQWVRVTDFPSSPLAKGKWSERSKITLAIAADGRITGCTADSGTALGQTGCSLIASRGSFLPALDRTGTRVATNIHLNLEYSINPVVRVPTPVVDTKPRYIMDPFLLHRGQGLTLAKEPLLPTRSTEDDAEIVVSVGAFGREINNRSFYCVAIVSSGDLPLDEATCAAFEKASYAQTGKSDYRRLTIMVRWTGGIVKIIPPSRELGSDIELGRNPRTVPIPPAGSVPGMMHLRFPADGSGIRCYILASTGTDQGDASICAYMEAAPYLPGIDIYGRARDASITLPAIQK